MPRAVFDCSAIVHIIQFTSCNKHNVPTEGVSRSLGRARLYACCATCCRSSCDSCECWGAYFLYA